MPSPPSTMEGTAADIRPPSCRMVRKEHALSKPAGLGDAVIRTDTLMTRLPKAIDSHLGLGLSPLKQATDWSANGFLGGEPQKPQ